MKYLLLLLVIPFLSATECGKKKRKTGSSEEHKSITDSLPGCFRKFIENDKNEIPRDEPLQIDEYRYNGSIVYLFTAPCCDQLNILYDMNCNIICAPSGGFTGRGDKKCEDFSDSANYIRLVWENPGNK